MKLFVRLCLLEFCKINIDTELRVAFAKAVRKVVAEQPDEYDPRKILGPAKEAMKEVARAKMRLSDQQGRLENT